MFLPWIVLWELLIILVEAAILPQRGPKNRMDLHLSVAAVS